MEYKDKDWLIEQYITNKRSSIDIAKEVGKQSRIVRKWLRNFNIPTRNNSEAIIARNGLSLLINGYLMEVLLGELLGDGCITKKRRSAAYSHHTSRKPYLVWLKNIFENNQLFCGDISSYIGKRMLKDGDFNVAHRFRSKYYPELLSIRNYFYPNGIKIIPKDLILTKTMILHWYLGDGSLHIRRGNFDCIRFCTNGFTLEDNIFLNNQLRSFGFNSNVRPVNKRGKIQYNILLYGKEQIKSFLDFLGPCPEGITEVYGHKWGIRKYKNR